MKNKILVVDDEVALQKAVTRYLKKLGYDVDSAEDGAQAVECFKQKTYDLVITDLKMPNMTGMELMKLIKKFQKDTSFLIMTGFGTIENAIEAIKVGAFHYITKPFNINDLGMLVEKALKYRRMKTENYALKKQVQGGAQFQNIVGCSEALKSVFQTVEKVVDTDSNILVQGESGTGKELIARAIHYNSKRSAQALIPVNCGAIPENLLESELFGHVKGAFTGAVASKIGKFEQAQGGTIFLDEIGDMNLKLQVKLLRVLQERRIEPVGSTESVEVDVRVVAATNRNLEEMVRAGAFREDLYYRLNVIPVRVPPLRERTCDIPLLINFFAEKYAKANGIQKPVFPEDVLEVLGNYKWPGNVRELENTVERLVVLRPAQKVMSTDLPAKFTQITPTYFTKNAFSIPEDGISLKKVVDDFENSLILKALDKTNWNKNRAANLLKLNRTTLVEKIKKRNITPSHIVSKNGRPSKSALN